MPLGEKTWNDISAQVAKHCENLDSAHDWDHVQRVTKLALRLFDTAIEGGTEHEERYFGLESRELVRLIGLLHDVGDYKFGYNQEELIGELLGSVGFKKEAIDFLLGQIAKISWRKLLKSEKSENHQNEDGPVLYKFVSDADRLDAMGNVGIARCFSYGGSRHLKLYDFLVPPNIDMTREAYDKQTEIMKDGQIINKKENNSLNHFYEKLLKLKDSLQTEEGRKFGEKRHQRLVSFVEGFIEEVNGES